MKIEISKHKLATTELVHHYKIKLNKNFYFIIATILIQEGLPTIITITRGVTYWDCQLRLKKEEKKLIKLTIEKMFNHGEH